MSGGHFDYQQYRLNEIARSIEELIAENNRRPRYSDETIAKFEQAVIMLEEAAIMAQRIDWLVSGDDDEESFHERWDEDLPIRRTR